MQNCHWICEIISLWIIDIAHTHTHTHLFHSINYKSKVDNMKIVTIVLTVVVFVHYATAKNQMLTMPNDEENETEYSDDYIDNEIDMKLTYRSGIERVLQGFIMTLKRSQYSFTQRLITRLRKPFISVSPVSEVRSIDNMDGMAFGDVLNMFQEDFHAIFPGTLWCGGGNAAKSDDDVGLFSLTDSCCRAHDNCPYNIAAGHHLEQLKNNGIFTRSACTCDYDFYKCLKNVGTVVSSNIGTTYFNILRPQCFGYHYPIKTCEKYDTTRLLDKKCYQYKLDESKNKTFEWYDLPDF